MGLPAGEPTALPWWQSRWAILPAALAIGIAMSFAQGRGHGGVFEWALVFTLGTGLAIAAFWHRRTTRWYWPAVALLVALHVAALVLHPWHMLPHTGTGSAIQIKGAAALDFRGSALFLYVPHLVFDPDAGPWTSTTKFVVAIVILFNVGIFAVGALVLAQAQ